MSDGAVERRQAARTTLGLPATLQRLGNTSVTGEARTCDLSEGGTRLVGPDQFQVGDVVVVTITSGDLKAEQQGLIVGSEPDAGDTAVLNVAFKTVGGSDLDVLRRILARS